MTAGRNAARVVLKFSGVGRRGLDSDQRQRGFSWRGFVQCRRRQENRRARHMDEDCFSKASRKTRQAMNPLDWWRQAHEEQLRLCDELEEIADSLPAGINRQKCIYAAKA